MGLSIHYSGTVKDAALIPQLTEEVQDVCTVLGWPCNPVNDGIVKGVSATPPECETLSLVFLPNGELVSRSKLLYNIHPATIISVKTQFAGMDVHMTLVKLLKHLSQRYFAFFELYDEGGYWESMDEVTLAKKIGLYNKMLDAVQAAMMKFNAVAGETREGFVQRLEKFLQKRLSKDYE